MKSLTPTPGVSPYSYQHCCCLPTLKGCETQLGSNHLQMTLQRQHSIILRVSVRYKVVSAPLRETFTPFVLNQHLLCLICFKVNGSRPKEELELLVRILEKKDYHNYVSFISNCYTKNHKVFNIIIEAINTHGWLTSCIFCEKYTTQGNHRPIQTPDKQQDWSQEWDQARFPQLVFLKKHPSVLNRCW